MSAQATKAERAQAVLADPRWTALAARDAAADGRFVFSVRSTGIYCRPSCPARRPKPENVAFHASCDEAERAGFRPCTRCDPKGPSRAQAHAALVAQACRLIDAQDGVPVLADLACALGISAFHLHRIFKQHTGLTPRAYAAGRRAERLRTRLAGANSVTQAMFDAGYRSSAGFYRNAPRVLGMPPARYRTGGADTEIRFAIGQCVLGAILVAQSTRGLCAILLGDDADALLCELQQRFPRARLCAGDAGFEQVVATVIGFVQAPGSGLNLPLDLRGTAFQQRVWQALQQIPPGQTVSYTELARRIGAPAATRAVASACAANALAVAIPCHRVVRIDGGLSGYRWGVERKRALLDLEARAVGQQT